jgi:hypothetical protein
MITSAKLIHGVYFVAVACAVPVIALFLFPEEMVNRVPEKVVRFASLFYVLIPPVLIGVLAFTVVWIARDLIWEPGRRTRANIGHLIGGVVGVVGLSWFWVLAVWRMFAIWMSGL